MSRCLNTIDMQFACEPKSAGGDFLHAGKQPVDRKPSPVIRVRALEPLIDCLCEYDGRRVMLERHGGSVADLDALTRMLRRRIQLEGDADTWESALDDPARIKAVLACLGNRDILFQVRRLASGLPVYYLCRVRHDCWGQYSLIVEDLYLSPGYPLGDGRFVSMMTGGHEEYFLRLSQFREETARQMKHGTRTEAGNAQTDSLLYKIGRHVFQAAWHEDQTPGFVAATHFGLPVFQSAIELLYLCLSGELCELRSAIDSKMPVFFKSVYPQPCIHALLKELETMDGRSISDLPRRALDIYALLAGAFRGFLSTRAPWGRCRARVPLKKILFANFGRVEQIAPTLRQESAIRTAAAALEREASNAIAELMRQAD